MDYNLIYHRPAVENTCDVCHGELSVRADDTEEAVRTILQDFHAKTEPVLDLFRRKELVVAVDGAKTAEEVHADILNALSANGRVKSAG